MAPKIDGSSTPQPVTPTDVDPKPAGDAAAETSSPPDASVGDYADHFDADLPRNEAGGLPSPMSLGLADSLNRQLAGAGDSRRSQMAAAAPRVVTRREVHQIAIDERNATVAADERDSVKRKENRPELERIFLNHVRGATSPQDAAFTAIAEAGEKGLLDRDQQTLKRKPPTLQPKHPPYNTHSEYGEELNAAIRSYNQTSLEKYEKEYESYVDNFVNELDDITSLDDLAAHGAPPAPISTPGYQMDHYASAKYDEACRAYSDKAKELKGEVPDGTFRLWGGVTVKSGDGTSATIGGGLQTSGGKITKGRGSLKLEVEDKDTGAGASVEVGIDSEGKSYQKTGGKMKIGGAAVSGNYGVDSDGKRSGELGVTNADKEAAIDGGVKIGGDSTGKMGISSDVSEKDLGSLNKQKVGDSGGVGAEDWNIVDGSIASFDGNKLSLKIPIPGIGETRGAVDVESATFQIGASVSVSDRVSVSLDLAFKGISVDTVMHAADIDYPGVRLPPAELADGQHWEDLSPKLQEKYEQLSWTADSWNSSRESPSPAARQELAKALGRFKQDTAHIQAEYETKLAAASTDEERQALLAEYEAVIQPHARALQEEIQVILVDDRTS